MFRLRDPDITAETVFHSRDEDDGYLGQYGGTRPPRCPSRLLRSAPTPPKLPRSHCPSQRGPSEARAR